MSSAAVLGLGTLLQLSDGGGTPVFTTIAEVTNITVGNNARDAIDVTSHDSIGPGREFIAGLLAGAELTIGLNFLPNNTTQRNLTTALQSTSSSVIFGTYRIVWPNSDGTSLTGTVNTGTDVWTTATHSWNTVQPIRFSTSGTLPTSTPQIVAGQIYYAGVTGTTTFKVYATQAAAIAGSGAIDFTTAGSGTHTVVSGTAWTFSAMVTGFEAAAIVDQKLTASPKFKITNSISIAP